jgi:hypothetical protein
MEYLEMREHVDDDLFFDALIRRAGEDTVAAQAGVADDEIDRRFKRALDHPLPSTVRRQIGDNGVDTPAALSQPILRRNEAVGTTTGEQQRCFDRKLLRKGRAYPTRGASDQRAVVPDAAPFAVGRRYPNPQ